ncbi:MAG: hypothetical protein KGL52_15495, partial [Rhodospirillales bacterium]|nr:hypothetical protein [Rhodospirillales bacterium]
MLLALLVAGVASARPAWSRPTEPHAPAPGRVVPIRSGEHHGFGRLVFDFPTWVGWHMSRDGPRVRLTFSRSLPFGPDPALPRNVRALTTAPGWVEVTVARGARLRRMRVGARLVLDVLDPPRRPAARKQPVVATRQAPPAPLLPAPPHALSQRALSQRALPQGAPS